MPLPQKNVFLRFMRTCKTEKTYRDDSVRFNAFNRIRLLNKKNSIVQTDRAKKATEQDFVNEAWTPIMTTIFNDDELILKWSGLLFEI